MRTTSSLALLLAATLATAAHADNSVTIHTSSLTTPEGYILMDDDPTLHIQVSSTLRRSDGAGITEDVRVRYRVNFVPQGGGDTVSGGTHLVIHENITPLYNQPIVDDIFSFPAELLTDTVEYSIEVSIAHDDGTGAFVDDETPTSVQRIGHFQRRLDFGGGILVDITGFSNPPVWLAATQNWQVRINGGTLLGADVPVGTYIATPTLEVDLDNAGKMVVVNGQLRIIAAPEFDMSGFPARRGGLTLVGVGGVTTNEICFDLPAGIGWRGQQSGLLQKELCASGTISLDPDDLQPIGAFGDVFAGFDPEIIADAYPIAFETAAWSFDSGVFSTSPSSVRFTRATAYNFHAVLTGSDTLPANSRLWENVSAIAGESLTITGEPDGGISINMAITPQATGFYTHFPLGRVIHAGGTVSIVDHKVDPATSRLFGATALVSYSRLCPPCPGEPFPDPTSLDLISTTAGMLPISPTGGLHGPGSPLPLDLHVGTRPSDVTQGIHDLDGFAQSHYHMPGGIVPAEDGQGTDDPGEAPASYNPARHLLTPLDRNNHNPLHPGGLAFLAGLGDHAGMNWQQFPGLQIESAIGDTAVPPVYDAAPWTRGYGRQSGFTGILQADPGDVPPLLQVYGYNIEIDDFGWSYLSNNTVASITEGELIVPYPSLFTLQLRQMMLSCCGDLAGFTVDPSDLDKELAYWGPSPFTIRSAGFNTGADDCPNECGALPGLLELGIDAPVAGTAGLHSGFIYPFPNGQLANGLEPGGRESYLQVGEVTIRGHETLPVGRAHFNNQDVLPLPPIGFVYFPAAMDVSYFEDIEGVVMTNPSLIDGQGVHYRAGWEDGGGDTFFTDPDFDPEHQGFSPDVATLQEYRTGNEFDPRARRDWFGGTFDFPVRFFELGSNSHFRSTSDGLTDLKIAALPGRITLLTEDHADLNFGAEFELLPKLTLANLAGLGIDEFTSDLESGIGTLLDDVEATLDALTSMATTTAQTRLNAIVIPASNALAGGMVGAVRLIPGKPDLGALATAFDAEISEEDIATALAPLNASVNSATSWIGNFRISVIEIRAFLEAIRNNLLTEEKMEELLIAMVSAVPNVPVDEQLVEEIWIEMLGTTPADSTLRILQDRTDELIAILEELELALADGGALVLEAQAAATNLVNAAAVSVSNLDQQVISYLDGTVCVNPGAYSDAELIAAISAMIRDSILGLDPVATMDSLLRNTIYLTIESVRTLLDQVFDFANAALKNVASAAFFIPEAPLVAVQGFGSHFLTGGLNGYAHTAGDDMVKLRLDGRLGLHLPTQVEFDGYLEYRHLTSQGGGFCEYPEGVRTHEFLVGASGGYSQFMRKTRKLSIDGKFTLNESESLTGIAGSVTLLDGGFSLGGLNAQKSSFHMAVGEQEFYLAGGVSAELNRAGFALAGGFFTGWTCSPDPLAWLPGTAEDHYNGFLPYVDDFRGTVMYGEGAANVFGRTCLARIRVGAGVGWYWQVPLDGGSDGSWGARLKGTASGELLCIINGKGEVVLDGGSEGMAGRATISRRTIWGGTRSRSLNVRFRNGKGFAYWR